MAAPRSTAEALRGFADRLFPKLDERSYYQLLDLPQDAPAGAVRDAFHRIAGELHPDRFYTLADPIARDRLEIIYARVCEAYRVLGNSDRRVAYDRALAQGRRRFDFAARNDSKTPRNPEDSLGDPEARQYFRQGMAALARRDFKRAIMNFTLAQSLEPASPLLAEKVAQAQAASMGGGVSK